MECSGRKRKGVDNAVECRKDLALVLSYLSLEDYSRRKKKCKELVVKDCVGSVKKVVTGVATAPPCSSACSDSPGRGLKRKIGCIDAATRLGRKKKIEQEYELGEVIGKGKFGSVVLCQSKASKEQLACKTLRKGEETVHREVEIMQHLSGHPGVVTLKAVYENSESFHLVMELCSGGRLLDQMAREGRYPEQRVAMIMKELMLTIRYCHEMGVVHRDIKPENILLTSSGKLKLADFGLAIRISDGQSLTGEVGSPAYVAPEVLLGDYSEKVDIWSAGVLLHALLIGVLPFHGDCAETVFKAIKNDSLDFNSGVWESVSPPARNLISCMLTRDVSARLDAEEVLMHPWILFYTEPTLKMLTPRSDLKNHVRLTSIPRAESERMKATKSSSLSDDSASVQLCRSSTDLQSEDSGLIDVLTVAISQVRISEPKRSRLCSPARTITQQQCSSNMNTSNLCTAF